MVEKLTKNLLNRIITEIKKEENQKRIEVEILNPILFNFLNRIYPYFRIVFAIFILNFILVLTIFILLIIINKNSISLNTKCLFIN
jgi:hypothetical protein